MLKKYWINILLIVLSFLILVAVGVSLYNIYGRDDQHIIKLNIDDGDSYALEFDDLALLPGEESNYTLAVKSGKSQKYRLDLDFCETEQAQTLKNYAYVRIQMGEDILCDKLLAELLDGEALSFGVDFTDADRNEVQITYYLPRETGNEVQGAEAFFELRIAVTNW